MFKKNFQSHDVYIKKQRTVIVFTISDKMATLYNMGFIKTFWTGKLYEVLFSLDTRSYNELNKNRLYLKY